MARPSIIPGVGSPSVASVCQDPFGSALSVLVRCEPLDAERREVLFRDHANNLRRPHEREADKTFVGLVKKVGERLGDFHATNALIGGYVMCRRLRKNSPKSVSDELFQGNVLLPDKAPLF